MQCPGVEALGDAFVSKRAGEPATRSGGEDEKALWRGFLKPGYCHFGCQKAILATMVSGDCLLNRFYLV